MKVFVPFDALSRDAITQSLNGGGIIKADAAFLFAANELGIWLDPKTEGTVFKDSAGISLASLGETAGLVLDKRNLNYSTYFGASGDFLSIANPNTTFGSIPGDFTLEGWLYWDIVPAGNADGNERQLMGQHNWPESGGDWWCLLGVQEGLYLYISNGGSYQFVKGNGFTWQANRWYHYAVVRTGTTVNIYLDGVLRGTGTNNKALMSANTRNLTLGADIDGNMVVLKGRMFGTRISKTAVYTGAFTPVAEVPSALPSTILLTNGVTWNGNPVITVNGAARASGLTPLTGLPGIHAYQTNPSYRPLYKTGTTTGKPCLSFNGSNQFLVTEDIDFSGTSAVSVFGAVKKLSDAATGVLVESYDAGSTSARAFSVYAPSGAAGNYALQSWKDASNHLLAVASGYASPNSAVIAANIKF